MNAVIGQAGVLLAFLSALLGIATLATGLVKGRPHLVRSGRGYTFLILAGALLAVGAMQHALITHDFSLRFVANNNSRSTPLLYTVAGMWSALEGSILLWGIILAGYLTAIAIRFRQRVDDPLFGWAMVTGFVVALFFFGLMLGPANPFRTQSVPLGFDGPGPNPLLQNHPLMAFHPPMLYLGYVGFTVPFAFAVGSLITGRLGEGWLVETRRWTLFAWGFLTVGIILGAWWSYEVLGWGGFWAWDPVENASFLPWLTGTAFIHSVMVQERRGMLRVWNLSLLIATFSLTILGTFLTRSGVLDSVHAFSQSSIGPLVLAFFGLVVLVGVGLIVWRGDRLRSPGAIDSPVSREGAFLANNLLFGAFAFVVLLGTVFPLITEAVNGQRISVGRPYFDRMTTPVALALLFLMAVAPALPWRKASTELLRHRLQWPAWGGGLALVACVALGLRGLAPLAAFGLGGFAAGAALRQLVLSARRQGVRGLLGRANGGMIVHLGVVVIAVAFAASASYAHRAEFRLNPGQSAHLAGHTVTYLGTEDVRYPNRLSTKARVRIDDGRVYTPSLSQYPFATQAIGTPSVRTGGFNDVYLTLVTSPEKRGGSAVIGVVIKPLVLWLWIGGGIMAIGTILSVLPGRRRRPTDAASAPVPSARADEVEAPDSIPEIATVPGA
ncbi:MAG: cytochrome c-type biosis protein CcmF [Actinomycetota bacterium]|jgi:cytochrome c-type biogenesis protein CcmF|nr:cytochrome c-type biosis protein CcmF [Actinomycetota bacterium]